MGTAGWALIKGMSIGLAHREGFKVLFDQMASTVTVYRNYGSEQARSFEFKAMKNNEKNRLDKVMFQFDRQVDVQLADVIQQKNTRDLWQVYEVEDLILEDILIFFEAKVRKYPGTSLPRNPNASVAITVQGHLMGGVQINSPNSSQNVILANASRIGNDVAQLKELLSDKRIAQIDREDASQALERVAELSKRAKTDEVIKRTKEKLDFVKSVFAVAKDVAQVAAPYIDSIGRLIGQ
jgi:hypothetical protein